MSLAPAHIEGLPRCRPRTAGDAPVVLPGGWRLIERVAEGPLAEVYRAGHADNDATAAGYAIKLLRPEWAQVETAVVQLRREAAAGSLAASPHLAPVLAQHCDESPPFIVFPWLNGADLKAILARTGRLSLAHSVWHVRQVALALDALHSAGWLHGDVKPANVLVSPEGHATLIDLGFARPIDEPATGLDRAVSRAVLGTPDYLAPEALRARGRVGVTSDLYSLGVMLYELLAGRLPCGASEAASEDLANRPAAARKLRAINPAVPASCARLIEQLLAVEPLRRPQSARELVDRLVAIEIETLAAR